MSSRAVLHPSGEEEEADPGARSQPARSRASSFTSSPSSNVIISSRRRRPWSLVSSSLSTRSMRRAIVSVLLLYVVLALVARAPWGNRLLAKQLGARSRAQLLLAVSGSSSLDSNDNDNDDDDDDGGGRVTNAAQSTSTDAAHMASSYLATEPAPNARYDWDLPKASYAQGEQGPRPAEFEQCGFWQEAYAERHRKILAGELPERYLVAVLHDAGVADQLLGVVTTFYWALLTGRAFQITAGHQQLPPLEAAFDAPFINWTRPLDPKELTERLYISTGDSKTTSDAARAYPTDGSVDTTRYAALYLANNDTHNNQLFRRTDLRHVFPNHPTIFVASNRGRTYRLFDNPHHRRALADAGLRPETAFGCAFRFLFAPNDAVMQTEAMQFTKKALRPTASVFRDGRESTQEVLRIGIQIRAGDWTFDKEEEQALNLTSYMPFFDCARQIEVFAKPRPDTLVLWYIISDSARVRTKALKRFGAERVVTIDREHKHVACNVVDCGGRDQRQALLDAVGDLISLSETDYMVLTQKSGFGKVAASLAIGNWHGIYWPDLPIGKGSFHNALEPRKIISTVGNCTAADYVLLEDVSDGWSGL